MLTKNKYIRRGDNVDQKKIYKEGRQCLTTTKKLYIRRGDNVDQKKLYIRRGDNVDKKYIYTYLLTSGNC